MQSILKMGPQYGGRNMHVVAIQRSSLGVVNKGRHGLREEEVNDFVTLVLRL